MGKGADMSWEDIQNEFDIMNRIIKNDIYQTI